MPPRGLWQRAPLVARFWARVDVRGPGECWEWTGARTRGYGVLGIGRRPEGLVRAPRLSWEIAHQQDVPGGLFVLHHCDNPPCVNPRHLFLGTNADNARDMTAKGRHGRWTRPDRTARGSQQGSARLTEDAVRQILADRRSGLTYKAIANRHGVAWRTIEGIVRGRAWQHITQKGIGS